MWRGLARRGSEKEKAAVPVPPLRPLRSRAAAAAAAGTGAGAAGEAGLGPGRAAPERRGRGAGRRGPCRPLSSPSAPPPPPAGLGPDAVRAAEPGRAPSVSRARTGRERVRWEWGRGGCRRLPGAPAVLGGGYGLVVSQRRPAAEFACDRRSLSLSLACLWPLPAAEARARRSLSFLSGCRLTLPFLLLPVLGTGRLEVEEVRPGPPPRPRWLRLPRPARPPSRRVEGLPRAPRRKAPGHGTASFSGGAVTPEDSGPASLAALRLPLTGFKSPGRGMEGTPLPPLPSSPSHPSFRGCFFLLAETNA